MHCIIFLYLLTVVCIINFTKYDVDHIIDGCSFLLIFFSLLFAKCSFLCKFAIIKPTMLMIINCSFKILINLFFIIMIVHVLTK